MSAMETEKIRSEQELLLALLRAALKGANYRGSYPETLDWDAFLLEARKQGISALCYYSAGEGLPAEIRLRWMQEALEEIAKHCRVSAAHAEVCALLEQNGIPTVTMKGCASASYYPHPGYRAMGDVDFYVESENFERARRLLDENGYEDAHKPGHHDWLYHKDGVPLELHFAVSGVPDGEEGEPFREALQNLVSHRRRVETDAGPVNIPGEFEHGLILLLHTAAHLLGGGIGLRHLSDWAVFVEHFTEEDFCALFRESFEKLRLWKFAQVLTQTCVETLGIRPCAWARAEREIVESFAREFLNAGDFSKYQSARRSDYLMSQGFSVRLDKRQGFGHLFRLLVKTVYLRWPWLRKAPILLPFGMLYYTIEYGFRILRGEKQAVHLGEMKQEAEARTALYKRFGLVDGIAEEEEGD